MNSNIYESEYNMFFKCRATNFIEFTKDITDFTKNYLDYIQKHKIFELNVNFF